MLGGNKGESYTNPALRRLTQQQKCEGKNNQMVIKCYKKLSGIEEWTKDWNTYVTGIEFFSPEQIPGNIMKEVKFELYIDY